jgi:phenylalanyl-tRNA synthetase alpha chain
MDILEKLDAIEKEFEEALQKCKGARDAEEARIKYLGRKGALTEILRSVSGLPLEQKKEAGKKANILKNKFDAKINEIKKGLGKREIKEKSRELDVTLPGVSPKPGTVHPITGTLKRINEIFISLGFSIEEGPEVETEFYNFEALNIPLDHPSRDAFDTFYIEGENLLRSHTSNVQIHLMQKQAPPIQSIMPGRVYRPDAVDASH